MAAELTDSWVNIRRARSGDDAEPLDLTGRLDQVVNVYRRVPSGRLVVLGRAGAGKTVLTLRVLRRAGAVYQFRHARSRDHLGS